MGTTSTPSISTTQAQQTPHALSTKWLVVIDLRAGLQQDCGDGGGRRAGLEEDDYDGDGHDDDGNHYDRGGRSTFRLAAIAFCYLWTLVTNGRRRTSCRNR